MHHACISIADASKAAALYQEEDHNVQSLGDPAKYTPSVKVDAKGSGQLQAGNRVAQTWAIVRG